MMLASHGPTDRSSVSDRPIATSSPASSDHRKAARPARRSARRCWSGRPRSSAATQRSSPIPAFESPATRPPSPAIATVDHEPEHASAHDPRSRSRRHGQPRRGLGRKEPYHRSEGLEGESPQNGSSSLLHRRLTALVTRYQGEACRQDRREGEKQSADPRTASVCDEPSHRCHAPTKTEPYQVLGRPRLTKGIRMNGWTHRPPPPNKPHSANVTASQASQQ